MILTNHSWDILQPLSAIVNNKLSAIHAKGELLIGGNGFIGMIYMTLPMKRDILKYRVLLWANFVGIHVRKDLTPGMAWEMLGAKDEWDIMCMQPLTWEEIDRRSNRYGGASLTAYELFLLSDQSKSGRRIGVADIISDQFDDKHPNEEPLMEEFDDGKALTTFNAVGDKILSSVKNSNRAEKRSVRIDRSRESVKISWIAGMMIDYSIKLVLSANSFATIEFRADDKTTSGTAASEDELNKKIADLLKALGIHFS